ncbi:MAG TPA: apolipoprotein N-acyltransferase [Gammaproteobacteria bacterium]|nr:apolipoprotein N-acyltransferase [Gammaproteobacteria bacterium]
MPAAFAPLGWWWLSPLLLALLFLLLDVPTPSRARRRAYFFGVGLFGVGVSWVYVAINVFGHTAWPVAALLTALFVFFLALFPALFGWLAARFAVGLGNGWRLLLIWPALWVLVEWLRGWAFTGFPWLNLGYSQISSPLAGWAAVLGVYGVDLAVAMSAGAVALLVKRSGEVSLSVPTPPPPPDAVAWTQGRDVSLPRRLVLPLVVLIVLWEAGNVALRIDWTRPVGAPLSVALVQGNLPQMTKWDPASLRERLDTYAALSRAHADAQLIVWPENSVTVFYHRLAEDYFRPLVAELAEGGAQLVVGLPYREPDGSRYYSSFASFSGAEGEPRFYHKRHLVPFGEYVPLEDWLRGLIGFFNLPMSGFSRGPRVQPLLSAAGHPVSVSICYEDAFGEEVIDALPMAHFLINGSNNAWYGDSLAPHQHLEISRMRAVETGRQLLRVTTNGISALVDERGRIRARSAQFETEVLRGEVQAFAGATPYVRWGNIPLLILLGLVVAVGMWRGRRAPSQSEPVSSSSAT